MNEASGGRLGPTNRQLLLFGRRGCSCLAPENTLAAFGALLEHGILGVELDARLCASGEVVVFHDDTLERITGLKAAVA